MNPGPDSHQILPVRPSQRAHFALDHSLRGVSSMAFGQRKMYDVSHLGLKCASCGVAITELPFQPSSDRPVYCRECARKRNPRSGSSRGPNRRY